jgi:hypothetical protein
MEKLGKATFGCLVAGVVVKAGFVGGLGMDMDNGCGVIGNALVVEGEAGRLMNLAPPWSASYLAASARMAVREWTPSNWSYGMTMRRGRRVFLMASRSSLVGFPLRGGGGVVGLFEEAGDCISVHDGWELLRLLANKGSISLGKRCRTVAVEDCDDDDQGNGVGKGKFRVLGAFRNASDYVGSQDCNGGSGSLLVSSSNLISIATGSKEGPKRQRIGLI